MSYVSYVGVDLKDLHVHHMIFYATFYRTNILVFSNEPLHHEEFDMMVVLLRPDIVMT